MYSCGSLAPKMRKGGCMDTHFQRPVEPWEKTEGSVLLFAHIYVSYCFVNQAPSPSYLQFHARILLPHSLF
ncbi:hypothetical protein GBAR_LOCUS12428 [Geodia barretti]|uniref:Uncharacterized protein n=1 Tax=Geodia barretti TaxID=519541 RepID=A0AA35WNU7_GEOBA|nr:hypothetical protein GBAR_LOCUS12428 [Geodia barretti]